MKNFQDLESEYVKAIKFKFGVTSKSKYFRLSNMMMMMCKEHKSTVSRMAKDLMINRRSVYRYIAEDLNDMLYVEKGFIYMMPSSLAMVA